MLIRCIRCAAIAALAPLSHAQVTNIATPGMPPGSTLGMDQTDRFANDFNPGLGFVFDMLGGYFDLGDDADSGWDFDVRTFEMTPAGYIDPSTWGWGTIVWSPDEEVELEEVALVYTGTPGNSSLRAGRFFLDFGKQMQAHVHDLRTVDRPLVLREFLGEEASGTGVQWDQWFAASDHTLIRYSLGVLPGLGGNFSGEDHAHGGPELEAGPEGAIPAQAELKDLGELNFTARLTGFTDFADGAHLLQYGGSARFVPEYSLTSDEEGIAPVDGLSNAVYGLDLTWGWQSDTGNEAVAAGLEHLWNTGDLGGVLVEDGGGEAIRVLDDTATGFYGWAEYRWRQQRLALGAQWSRAEVLGDGLSDVDEYDVYYTWNLNELNRIRFALTMSDPDDGETSYRAAVQLTAFLGPHAHGVNW